MGGAKHFCVQVANTINRSVVRTSVKRYFVHNVIPCVSGSCSKGEDWTRSKEKLDIRSSTLELNIMYFSLRLGNRHMCLLDDMDDWTHCGPRAWCYSTNILHNTPPWWCIWLCSDVSDWPGQIRSLIRQTLINTFIFDLDLILINIH